MNIFDKIRFRLYIYMKIVQSKIYNLIILMKTENQGLIHFLEVYESENYAERLHQALYYVAGEGEPDKEKQ